MASWERDTMHFFTVYSLFYLGELRELAKLAPALLRNAVARGDLYAATNLRVGLPNTAWLVAGDVAGARDRIDEAAEQWTSRWFHLQHYHQMLAVGQLHLYAGEPGPALETVHGWWSALEASQILRISLVRYECWHLRARLAIAAALEGGGARGALWKRARRDAARVARADEPGVVAKGELGLAAIDHADGNAERAVERLRRAIAGFEGAEMASFAAVARAALGRVLGGDEGAELIAGARAWLRGQTVVDPDRWIAMLAPGF